jgi:hypothetical protein
MALAFMHLNSPVAGQELTHQTKLYDSQLKLSSYCHGVFHQFAFEAADEAVD